MEQPINMNTNIPRSVWLQDKPYAELSTTKPRQSNPYTDMLQQSQTRSYKILSQENFIYLSYNLNSKHMSMYVH